MDARDWPEHDERGMQPALRDACWRRLLRVTSSVWARRPRCGLLRVTSSVGETSALRPPQGDVVCGGETAALRPPQSDVECVDGPPDWPPLPPPKKRHAEEPPEAASRSIGGKLSKPTQNAPKTPRSDPQRRTWPPLSGHAFWRTLLTAESLPKTSRPCAPHPNSGPPA